MGMKIVEGRKVDARAKMLLEKLRYPEILHARDVNSLLLGIAKVLQRNERDGMPMYREGRMAVNVLPKELLNGEVLADTLLLLHAKEQRTLFVKKMREMAHSRNRSVREVGSIGLQHIESAISLNEESSIRYVQDVNFLLAKEKIERDRVKRSRIINSSAVK